MKTAEEIVRGMYGRSYMERLPETASDTIKAVEKGITEGLERAQRTAMSTLRFSKGNRHSEFFRAITESIERKL